MGKLIEAREILKSFGLPSAQQNEISAFTLLALCNVKEYSKWINVERKSLGISKGIMEFIKKEYHKKYAPNTRETFRRQVLHQFIQARIVVYNPDNSSLPVNSPHAHYAITNEALKVIKSYKTKNWKKSINHFISSFGKLDEIYQKKRDKKQIPLKLSDGKILTLSPGKHNIVKAAIINEFAPRFAKNGILIYLGDTAKKNLYLDKETSNKLNIPITQHTKLPDVVIYLESKNWLFLIEAVTSHGPVSPKRMMELEKFLKNSKTEKIYISAFPDIIEFRKHASNISWETEVWIMNTPDHMIHFNGDKFIGPYK